jgi:hypothetical protein
MNEQWPNRNDKIVVNSEVVGLGRKRLWSSPNGTEEDHEISLDILSPGSNYDRIRSRRADRYAKTRIDLRALNLILIFTL